MTSVVIPCHNDDKLLNEVIWNLAWTAGTNDFEVVVVNDGSTDNMGKFRHLKLSPILNSLCDLRIANITRQRGVGFAFDTGVNNASGDIIVLMGADIYSDENWLQNVTTAVVEHPFEIGCSACVGITLENRDIHRKGRKIRYGADMLIQMCMEDLPLHRQKEYRVKGITEYYDLFRAKWKWGKESDEPYEIPCLLGAFYFTSKEFYQKIHGWDTGTEKYQGHMLWGHLEPYLSLKAYLYGGAVRLYPDIETGHIFGRLTKRNMSANRAIKPSYWWWNALFMAYTMCDEDTAKRIIEWVKPTLAFNRGSKYIRQHYENVLKIKERNKSEFVKDVTWYMERFDYKLK